jgi:uncharacterized membrane protein YeiB
VSKHQRPTIALSEQFVRLAGWSTADEGSEWLLYVLGTIRAIKIFSLLFILVMLGVGLAACGGSSSSSSSAEDTMAAPAT